MREIAKCTLQERAFQAGATKSERIKLGTLLAGSRNQEEASITGAAWAKRKVVDKTSENLLEVRS